MSSESASTGTVVVQVPGSTSNLGSGFDTLGLAVNRHTRVEARFSGKPGLQIDSDTVHSGLIRVASEAAATFFEAARVEEFGTEIEISTTVPVARGLGYSATIR